MLLASLQLLRMVNTELCPFYNYNLKCIFIVPISVSGWSDYYSLVVFCVVQSPLLLLWSVPLCLRHLVHQIFYPILLKSHLVQFLL